MHWAFDDLPTANRDKGSGRPILRSGGAALGTMPEPVDSALARVIDAWASLPEPIRAAVLALVDAARRMP